MHYLNQNRLNPTLSTTMPSPYFSRRKEQIRTSPFLVVIPDIQKLKEATLFSAPKVNII